MLSPSTDVFNAPKGQSAPKIIKLCSKESLLEVYAERFSRIWCKTMPMSLSWLKCSFDHVDSFAVIEASLTSVKYAIYHAFGYLFLCSIGYHDMAFSMFLTSIIGGFIGGGLFTVPYLVLLLSRDVLPSGAYANDDLASHVQRSLLLVTEMMYSAAAGAVGMLVINMRGWYGDIIMGVYGGFLGPLISYTILYLSLKLLLAVWAVNM